MSDLSKASATSWKPLADTLFLSHVRLLEKKKTKQDQLQLSLVEKGVVIVNVRIVLG